jgi:hypothetical protein
MQRIDRSTAIIIHHSSAILPEMPSKFFGNLKSQAGPSSSNDRLMIHASVLGTSISRLGQLGMPIPHYPSKV